MATVRGKHDIPDGEYGFLELYCDEPDCDCRRVVIHVVAKGSGQEIWATINYGWERPEYYAMWVGDQQVAQDMTGATLDPLNPQTQYSPALLKLFEFILQDEAYVARLKRHYQLFKAELRREAETKITRMKRPKRSQR